MPLSRLASIPSVPLGHLPSPVERMDRLRDALGGGPALFVKRDDAIPFAFGGNKVRKLPYVIAEALAQGADTLITCGGVQSNHARATTAAAVKYGLAPVLVANGAAPDRASGNALLDQLMGAEVHYVSSREARAPAMAMLAESLRSAGRKPYVVPLGASTPLGALGYVRAVGELLDQGVRPDVIVHACSSGGTTAGLAAGCTLHGLHTRIIGVSADDPAAGVLQIVRETVAGVGTLLGEDGPDLSRRAPVEIDDGQVGEGYGIPTERSREAQRLAATKEAIFVDHTYTAKALGALIAWVREERFRASETVLFWHTGGQVGIFA
ncbi:MAG TPA: D-cysteine desulfhydrase family protein [Gemmatimonadales bacterium]|nr:D-cysteine desulfhydrase family protein [Gemmatimonadales bacterium]